MLDRVPDLSQAAIARDWKTSREYVRQCVGKGCPVSSFEDARLWRQAYASTKASTHPKQIAQTLAEEKGDDSPQARPRLKKFYESKPESARLPSGNSLNDALAKAVRASDEASRLLDEAMAEGKDAKISIRLGIHNKALEALLAAEAKHREEQERRRILIPLSEAMDLARRGYDIILRRLAALPQNVAARCNPANPHIAMAVLEAECTAILVDAGEVYAAWSKAGTATCS